MSFEFDIVALFVWKFVNFKENFIKICKFWAKNLKIHIFKDKFRKIMAVKRGS